MNWPLFLYEMIIFIPDRFFWGEGALKYSLCDIVIAPLASFRPSLILDCEVAHTDWWELKTFPSPLSASAIVPFRWLLFSYTYLMGNTDLRAFCRTLALLQLSNPLFCNSKPLNLLDSLSSL